MIGTLVVFRNNISHGRYNEARAHLATMKNGLRTAAVIVLTTGINVKEGPRFEAYKAEAKEIIKQLQVRRAARADGMWRSLWSLRRWWCAVHE
jgi:predicted membrane chloride channel (bestrophin family)